MPFDFHFDIKIKLSIFRTEFKDFKGNFMILPPHQKLQGPGHKLMNLILCGLGPTHTQEEQRREREIFGSSRFHYVAAFSNMQPRDVLFPFTHFLFTIKVKV